MIFILAIIVAIIIFKKFIKKQNTPTEKIKVKIDGKEYLYEDKIPTKQEREHKAETFAEFAYNNPFYNAEKEKFFYPKFNSKPEALVKIKDVTLKSDIFAGFDKDDHYRMNEDLLRMEIEGSAEFDIDPPEKILARASLEQLAPYQFLKGNFSKLESFIWVVMDEDGELDSSSKDLFQKVLVEQSFLTIKDEPINENSDKNFIVNDKFYKMVEHLLKLYKTDIDNSIKDFPEIIKKQVLEDASYCIDESLFTELLEER